MTIEERERIGAVIREGDSLYAMIDKAIDNIVISRLNGDKKAEAKAIFQIESVVVYMAQYLLWANQELNKILEK